MERRFVRSRQWHRRRTAIGRRWRAGCGSRGRTSIRSREAHGFGRDLIPLRCSPAQDNASDAARHRPSPCSRSRLHTRLNRNLGRAPASRCGHLGVGAAPRARRLGLCRPPRPVAQPAHGGESRGVAYLDAAADAPDPLSGGKLPMPGRAPPVSGQAPIRESGLPPHEPDRSLASRSRPGRAGKAGQNRGAGRQIPRPRAGR